jgi:hypothetical protein
MMRTKFSVGLGASMNAGTSAFIIRERINQVAAFLPRQPESLNGDPLIDRHSIIAWASHTIEKHLWRQ